MLDETLYEWDEYNFQYREKPVDHVKILQDAFREQLECLEYPMWDLFGPDSEITFCETIIECLLYRSDNPDFNFAADNLKGSVIGHCRSVWDEVKDKISGEAAAEYGITKDAQS